MSEQPSAVGPPGPQPPEVSDEGWQKFHPLSPVLRGGVVALALAGYLVSRAVDELSRVGGDPPGRGGRSDVDQALDHPFIVAGAFLAIVAGGVLLGWLSWRFSRFRITPGQVEMRTGWLFRQHRQVPIERIQAVEISRPLLAQLTGLAQVVVQSAGGGDSQLKLAFLSRERADSVRDHILTLADRSDERPSREGELELGVGGITGSESVTAEGGLAPPGEHTAYGGPRSEGREVLAVPNGRLFVATILHGSTIVLGAIVILAGSALAGSALGDWGWAVGLAGGLPALLPPALAVAVGRVKELLKHGNFRLSDLGRSVRIRHGLTDQRATTIPLHRVQALKITQPLWWRPLGWWRADVNVAGVKADDDNPFAQTALLPVGTLEEALRVLTLVDPMLSWEDLERAALADGEEGGWRLVSPRARWLDPFSWRRKGYAVTGHGVLVRDGRWRRTVTVAPHARVQSITLQQGPLERRLDLAGVTLVSTPGPVRVVIDHLSAADALVLLHEETERTRVARREVLAPAARERWTRGAHALSPDGRTLE